MNSSSNPLIRPSSPFERRLVSAIESSKPGRSVGLSNRPLPGGASLNIPRSRGGVGSTHPFKVRHKTGNVFTVQAGTCEGKVIATQDIDVGSTRPVAILAYPKYALSIYNSEYVWAASVKTGADAPVLTYSTTILSDVSTGITTAGTEARALIAGISTGNIITQITTGNIIGSFADDGSFTGKMAGSFNKNA